MDDNLKQNTNKTAYTLDVNMYLKVCELAKAKGKKPGDSMEEEIHEIMRANPEAIQGLNGEELLQHMKDKKILIVKKKDDK